jgi:hypothetical protein
VRPSYTSSLNLQKRAFNSGARHTTEKLLRWALQQQESGEGVVNLPDLVNALQVGRGREPRERESSQSFLYSPTGRRHRNARPQSLQPRQSPPNPNPPPPTAQKHNRLEQVMHVYKGLKG